MSRIRILLLLVLAAALLAVAIATWGSIGSAALLFCLLTMGAALLVRWMQEKQDSNDYDMEQ